MLNPAAKTAKKQRAQRGKPFAPGQSGNPTGRPQGSRNKASILLDKILLNDAGAVALAVVKAAKQGDMQAARMILDRAAPIPRGRAVKLQLPDIAAAKDVLAAQAAAVAAMARGEITPDEAATVANVLELKRRALETADIEARVAALEQKAKGEPT